MKDQSGLVKWKERVGEQEAKRVMRRASGRGTDMHNICEDYINNKDHIFSGRLPLAIELFKNIQPVIDEHVELVYGNEIALFSHTLKTAGRTDLFCRFMGVNTIADYKTSIKEKKKEWIEDYFIQSTVYAIMVEEMYKDIMPIHIPQIAIIIALEEGEKKYQLFVERTSDWRDKAKLVFAQYHEQYDLPNPEEHPIPA
jgi:genome maintenance exonuclease 1